MATKDKAKAVTYRHIRGRYVTSDGLAFTTMEQAEAHCKKLNIQNKKQNENE